MILNINTDACFRYADKLEKLHRSSLPNAVRGALNDTALDVKQNSMPKEASIEFVNRTKTFFKANSKVNFAKGWDINLMKSEVGFFENRLVKQATNYSIKDLEQQEYGGEIDGKAFIPTVLSRLSRSYKRLVKANARLSEIRKKGIVVAEKMGAKTPRQRFVQASFRAGVGGNVLYKGILWRIESFDGHKKVKRTPLYSVKKGRSVRVKPTGFMREASETSHKKMEMFFIKRAKFEIEKRLGK